MCQLLALNFNRNVRPNISFQGFHKGGAAANPHGWGLAMYDGKAAKIFKEPIRADNSALAEFCAKHSDIQSQIFIGHVRYASAGRRNCLANTHPFSREFRGRDVVLVHNGTIKGQDLDALKVRLQGRFAPIGDTDSEVVLCVLLEWLADQNINLEDFAKIEEHLNEINCLGTLNLAFSDGENLYVYHDRDGYRGLMRVHRKYPFPKTKLHDRDWSIDLGESKDREESGYVIATEALSDENWEPFAHGKLVVFRRGEIVFPLPEM